jgi:hypothetical protein
MKFTIKGLLELRTDKNPNTNDGDEAKTEQQVALNLTRALVILAVIVAALAGGPALVRAALDLLQ